MSGSLVSARKLAASLWEQYTEERLQKPDCEQHQHSSHAQAQLVPPLRKTVCPSDPLICKLCKGPVQESESTKEASDSYMVSNQMGLMTNVLHRMKSLEESQSQYVAVLHKLKLGFQDVANRVEELEFSQKYALKEVHSSLQTYGEQMAITRRKEQEKARLAFLHLRQEMEEERKICRLLKLQNKKLASSLMNAGVAAADAYEELGRERKAREVLEEVCDELAKEIGEDKAEVEHLKWEQERARKRLEEELKEIKMDALWQDERMKDNACQSNIELYKGIEKQSMSWNELRSKIQAFVDAAEDCTHKGIQEQIEKQAEQAKILSQALCLLDLHSLKEGEDRKEEVGSPPPPVSRSACSTTRASSQEKISIIAENMRNRVAGNQHMHEETENLHGVEHKVSNLGKRKPTKLRRLMQVRWQQRRNSGMANHKSFHMSGSRGNSAWTSSEDEPDQGQLITSEIVDGNDLQHGGKQFELSESSNGAMSKESIRLKNHRISIGAQSHSKHPAPADLRGEAHAELCGKLEADLPSNIPYSNLTSCVMRVDERGGKQESALHAQGGHTVIKGQELSSDISDKRNLVYYHIDNLDMHRSTSGSRMGFANTTINHTSFQPVIGASDATIADNPSHERDGYHDPEVNRARVAKTRSDSDDEAVCGKADEYCQGRKDFEKVHENAESITLPTIQMLNKFSLQGSDNEIMEKISPRRPTSVKSTPLLHFWSPTSNDFSSFGGATKHSIKACTLSSTNAQDKRRHAPNRNDMHLSGNSMTEGTIAQELANQQPLPYLKGTSLGAQLVKARELEDEQKPAKAFFQSSPLRRAVSYG